MSKKRTMGRHTSITDFAVAMAAGSELDREASELLNPRAWKVLRRYGRIVGGPYSGLYVSGVPVDLQREIVRRLAAGETLLIHLMHTHRSGRHQGSATRWAEGELVMVYEDREVRADAAGSIQQL
jgi:hypothetical protein